MYNLKLKQLRNYLNLSYASFGDKIGYSPKQVSRYEKGETVLGEELIDKICKAFEIDKAFFTDELAIEQALKQSKQEDSFVDRLVSIRKEKGLTQSDLAHLVGCKVSYISFLETGRVNLTKKFAKRLSEVLEVGQDWLLEGNEANKYYPVNEKLIAFLKNHEELRKQLYKEMEKND